MKNRVSWVHILMKCASHVCGSKSVTSTKNAQSSLLYSVCSNPVMQLILLLHISDCYCFPTNS